MSYVAILLCIGFITHSHYVYAVSLKSDQMSINNIPFKNILGDNLSEKSIKFGSSRVADMTFYPDTQEFGIVLTGDSYTADKIQAEKDIIRELEVTKNEACLLPINIVAPAQTYGALDELTASPTFCSSPAQQDLNDDSVVNGVDFGQCIADYETSDEAESAFDRLTKREVVKLSTGQSLESLYELDLPCDFNVNRHIDALDLSTVIEAIKQSSARQK